MPSEHVQHRREECPCDRVRLHRRRWRHGRLRGGRPADPGRRHPGAAAGGRERRADPRHDRAGRVAAAPRHASGLGRRHHRARRMRGRWPIPGAGPWAGPARSTPWRTSAGTGRSTTAGPRAGRLAGVSRTCCRTSGAASRPKAATRRCAEPSGPVRVAPAAEAARHPVARAFAEALGQIGCPVDRRSQRPAAGGRGLGRPGHRRRPAGQPGRCLPAARPGPPEPDGRGRLPGHPPAGRARPLHRRELPPRRRAGPGAAPAGR